MQSCPPQKFWVGSCCRPIPQRLLRPWRSRRSSFDVSRLDSSESLCSSGWHPFLDAAMLGSIVSERPAGIQGDIRCLGVTSVVARWHESDILAISVRLVFMCSFSGRRCGVRRRITTWCSLQRVVRVPPHTSGCVSHRGMFRRTSCCRSVLFLLAVELTSAGRMSTAGRSR